ncbi:MAG: helix-turn-helix domain-containing protein [Bryobacteraceae bacterium]
MSSPISETAVSLPAPALRPFIAQYAGFRVSGLPPGAHSGLPSSDADLIISLGRPIEVVQMPNSTQRPSAFTALVSGLQDAPAIVRQTSDAFGLHVFIRPLGVRAILGVASAEISSLVLNLSEIWGNRAGDLVEMLRAANTWRRRFAILDRALLSKLNPISPQPEIAWAWRRLQKANGAVPIERLADEIGWSRWRFSGRFRDAIGVTPKTAARVFRFERACQLIKDERPGLAHVAAACGYFDQAHMTREWNALAGCSPRAWISSELPFLQDYELGGRHNESHDLESVHQSFV